MIEHHLEVDACGVLCPLPLLRLKKALQQAESGQVLRLTATDPAAHLDIGVFAEQTGHLIIEYVRETDLQVFYIRKK